MAQAPPSSSSSGPSLCVGMATHGDFDGVWFTIQALRMYHPEVADDLSFVVIDNDPGGPAAGALRAIGDQVPRYRYVPFAGYSGTAVRDLVFREADADVVCCVDSHVLLVAGALVAVRDWFGAHPQSLDLLQGPMLHDNLEPGGAVTHLTPTWGAGMFGQWGRDPRLDDAGGEPFEIEMHGLGLFACRRAAWPGLNPRLRGFGAEEGYLHERVRRRGGRVLCDPRLVWAHRFGRPFGIPYPNRWEDRMRNYLVAWGELGWDVAPMEAHFHELLGSQFDVGGVLERVHAEVEHPLGLLDAVFCLAGGDGGCAAHAHPMPIAWRVERVEVDPALEGEHRRLAGWHAALTAAGTREYRHALLLDDASGPDTLPAVASVAGPDALPAVASVAGADALPAVASVAGADALPAVASVAGPDALPAVASVAGPDALPAIDGVPWDLCLLRVASPSGMPAGSFTTAGQLAMAGLAVAVHADAYARILADVGSDEAGREAFLARWPDVDTYLLRGMTGGTFVAVGEPFAEPAVDRPVQAPGLTLIETAAGLTVQRATEPGVHELNNTAAMVLTLCDGRRTVVEVAQELALGFALVTPPLAEVSACVDGLRRAGMLVARTLAERP